MVGTTNSQTTLWVNSLSLSVSFTSYTLPDGLGIISTANGVAIYYPSIIPNPPNPGPGPAAKLV